MKISHDKQALTSDHNEISSEFELLSFYCERESEREKMKMLSHLFKVILNIPIKYMDIYGHTRTHTRKHSLQIWLQAKLRTTHNKQHTHMHIIIN